MCLIATCHVCRKPILDDGKSYRKVTDLQKVTRHWHNSIENPCWDPEKGKLEKGGGHLPTHVNLAKALG